MLIQSCFQALQKRRCLIKLFCFPEEEWSKMGALSYVCKSIPQNKNEGIAVKWFSSREVSRNKPFSSVLTQWNETWNVSLLWPVPSSVLNHLQIGIALEKWDWLILTVWKSKGRWHSQTCQRTLNWFSFILF